MSAKKHTLTTGGGSDNTSPKTRCNQLDTLIIDALDSLKAELHRRISEMLNGADQHLSDFPEFTESDEMKEHYKKLIGILHFERNKIDTEFFKALNEINYHGDQTQIGESKQQGGLSLVDQDEMDEMVAVTAMYSKALNKYEEEVNNLEARIEYLERSRNITAPRYTFNPKHICEAFQTALSQIDIPLDYKLLLFKLFDQEVSSRLGEMYRSINQLFITADVMPEVVYSVERQDSETESAKPTCSTPTSDTGLQTPSGEGPQIPNVTNPQSTGVANRQNPRVLSPANPSVISSQNPHVTSPHRPSVISAQSPSVISAQSPSVISPQNHEYASGRGSGRFGQQRNSFGNSIAGSQDEISRLLNQFMAGSGTARGEGVPESFSITPSDTDGYSCYSRNDLMNALSNLQGNLVEVDLDKVQAIDAENIKRAILADMGRSNGGAIAKKVHVFDQRRIDFVGMMFHAIATDKNISTLVVNLIRLLQIPVTKAAIFDEHLFTKKDHPVRSTLDLITKAGRGITEDSDSVFVALKAIVDRLLQDYDADLSSFDRAADALQTLIKDNEEECYENERIERHALIKQHARRVVLGEMRRITLHKVIPKKVRPLMLKHWPTLMFNYYINRGIQSSEWLGSLKLFNRLMESLQPISNVSQWRRLKDNHESLIASVREELYRTRQDKAEIDTQISELKKTFWKMLDLYEQRHLETQRAETADQSARTEQTTDEENIETTNKALIEYDYDANVARIKEEARIAEEKISKLPGNLHPGVWFEVFNGEDKPVRRLKLSVLLTEAAKLIFVDRHGVKVIEKDVNEFLRELDNEQSRFIADHSTFEQALATVIHKLAA